MRTSPSAVSVSSNQTPGALVSVHQMRVGCLYIYLGRIRSRVRRPAAVVVGGGSGTRGVVGVNQVDVRDVFGVERAHVRAAP